MGCSSSKEAHVAELQADDAHVRRRRAQAKHHLAVDCTLGDEHPPPLKLAQRVFIADADDAAASRTPAVTPQAEAGRCSEPPRRTSDAKETRGPVHAVLADTERAISTICSGGVPSSSCAQRGLPGRRVSTKKASCGDIDGGAQDRSCRRTGENECEETEGRRNADGVENAEDADTSLQEQQGGQRQLRHKRSEEARDGAAWPTPPPVLLVLHLFLENNRPPRRDSRPPRRVRFPGGLAYEGQLRRRHRPKKKLDQHDQGDEDEDEELPHGWGRIVFPDGAFYEGCWRGGIVHGKGALHLANGNCYFGSWARGRKHGLGTYLYADGSCHEGFYSKGERSGVGTMHYASGAVYEGEFKAGLRHGVGRLEHATGGASYDGDWVNDMPHGHGVHVDPAGDGERFEGSWRRGIRSGGGTLVQGWAEKGEQEGEQEGEEEQEQEQAEEAEREREGAVASEVAWYSGNFSGGYPHGDGMMMYGSMTYWGHVERGVWNGGGRIDLGEPGLGSFEGSWLDGIPRGSGRWQCKQGRLEVDCTFEQGYSGQIGPK